MEDHVWNTKPRTTMVIAPDTNNGWTSTQSRMENLTPVTCRVLIVPHTGLLCYFLNVRRTWPLVILETLQL
jgi:hypothetical protein